MSEPEKSDKPVSMNKGPAHADSEPSGSRPRTVVAATIALAASGVAAFVGAIALYGQRTWLTNQFIDAHSTSISKAVTSAVASASSSKADTASASSAASASATKHYPTTAAGVHDQVSQQQSTTLIMTIFFVAVLAFVGYGVYRGRHWARWGSIGFWFLASLATPFGIGGLLSLGRNDITAAYRVPLVLCAALFTAGVVLANLRPSIAYFALSRPAPRPGAPERRSLFAPRTPPQRTGTAPARKPAQTRSAAPPTAEASATDARSSKQRAKKRAASNADAVARGAELARSRAKASKSRKTDS